MSAPQNTAPQNPNTPGAVNKGDGGSSSHKTWSGSLAGRLLQSAPGKFNSAKEMVAAKNFLLNQNPGVSKPDMILIRNQEEGEIIPAAMYEPSGDIEVNSDSESESSDDFAKQVHEALGDGEGPSKGSTGIWLAGCETDIAAKTKEILLNKVLPLLNPMGGKEMVLGSCDGSENIEDASKMQSDESGGIFSNQGLGHEISPSRADTLMLKNVINPSEKLKEQR